MKKRIIRNLMSIFIATLFIISVFFIPVTAEPGEGQGEGNGNMDPPTPPKGSDDDDSGYHNQEGLDDQKDDQNQEQNENNEDTGENNQNRYQNREGDADNDQVDDNQERYQHRKMEMEFKENRLKIRSEWERDGYEDEFDLLFDMEDGLRLKIEYENNMNTSENQLNFEVKIKELFEYRDENNNGRYDENDTIVKTYAFEKSNFKNLTYQKQFSEDNEMINLVSAQTVDNIFKINLYFSDNFSNINNQILTPSEVKIDFIINNFTFQEEDTQLALRTTLDTDHETDLDIESFDEINGFSQGESALDITTLNTSGFFSWQETVIVDGVVKPVNSTIKTQTEETIRGNEKISNQVNSIYFSYPRGSTIVHDPKIGVASISFQAFALQSISNLVNLGSIYSYVGICILASILFIGIIFIRKRF